MELIPYLLTQTKLNRVECEAIDDAFTRKTFAKGTILTQPDNHHQNVYFIEKGLLRAFYNLNRKDITHYFSMRVISCKELLWDILHPIRALRSKH